MNKFYNETLNKLENEIKELEIETNFSVQKIETAIKFIIHSLTDLKKFVLKNDFRNLEEEIHFFKYQKLALIMIG
ncbi:hypothetical protein [Sphingobacterium sp. IITKGP-BTPF85]|uniref:hypothetical protein n=1 Tax=Sphingobacterium sp. IITKGP-BTPF85 TaxID=1338009 RepID=UPI00038A42FD|nr:hypothetical protein [Sphingobacterium sp. IITKGP-BTPF85]KKX47531.1 hypothetical protein L950_0225895 [Sphingobacterium sp. IITKGP-BTPF85]